MMPRLDRLLTLYCFRPLGKLRPATKPAVPILMYHSISPEEEYVHPYYRINTSPAVFADQMRYLGEQGYRTISLQELHDKAPHAKNVVLTFDDGYADFYTSAFPVLQRYGFTATVFLPTNYIGSESFNRKNTLTWPQVAELQRSDISFGSHTHTHPQLRNLSRAEVRRELVLSKEILENKLGRSVTLFSYPYRFTENLAAFVRFLEKELQRAGYTQGVTTRIGCHHSMDNPFFMKRLPINTCDDLSFFKAKIEGNYDWLSIAQVITKRLKEFFP
jgi:peptidoglycan/xylan/chitin deacetylase (PgdA/CDA1 family)